MKSPTEQPINDKRKKVAIISRSGKQCRQKRVHAEIGTPGHRGLALSAYHLLPDSANQPRRNRNARPQERGR